MSPRVETKVPRPTHASRPTSVTIGLFSPPWTLPIINCTDQSLTGQNLCRCSVQTFLPTVVANQCCALVLLRLLR
ncbi:hypothetical protein BST61_g337 [Cercospora zeina]